MDLDSMGDWVRTQYTSQVTPDLDGQEVTLFGWVQEVRDLGGLRFLILQDREGTVQITIPKKRISPQVLAKSDSLQKRFSFAIKGTVKKTNMTQRGVEVIPTDIKIFSTATEQLPIDITGKTPANIEVRLDARPLDLTLETSLAAFKIQHVALQAIRTFLFDQDFMEAHSPRIIASATEGGAELFCIDYFGQKAYLAQSPQLYKEELTLSFEKVFEVGPFFRAEESHTRRHLSEFTSVDVEMAFANADNVMTLLEQTIHHTVGVVKEKCQTELNLLNHNLEVPPLPFKRLTYTQVLEDLKTQGVDIPWGEDITTDALRVLGKIYPDFYFITEWPTHTKAFYIKPQNDNPKISEGFDLMYGYIELTSGGTRICDKTQLIERLKEKGLNPDSFKMHLQAFDYGMPPHAGWAIGLERLTMILTGIKNIREVTLYPRDRVRLTP
ncbi:aspartate--tRNA(Asn) ligase [Candidatus Bathycorpusculum sp.]|uniref:aspartate--tRNA(Asn) ligase n=1 Tax=Candidatus Bathycorpusculum sp. TaxID=2994959 RepID=UPI002819316B|nr:aspartate--tRNA(Asn) ligase [Candidatus Termitimicrobium sp.]MCL2685306.1 aspartate--tRNA(Asn) ligase [Candidatus Termitimicrobium sp.]